MREERPITELAAKVACCAGETAQPHEAIELMLLSDKAVTCPICGRRFRRKISSGKIDPAVWPKGD